MSTFDRIEKAKKERAEEEARAAAVTSFSSGQGGMSRIEKARQDRAAEEAQAATRTVTTAQEVAPAAKKTRAAEEIKADLDKAKERLDLFDKTTPPLFEASWHKQSRQEAQSQVDALKAEWKETTGWDYDEYNADNRSLLQKILDPILDVGGDAALSGVGQFTTGVANTADLFLGKPLQAAGWKNNPASVGADIMNQYNAELSKQLSETAKEYNVPQKAAEALSAAVAAAPMAIMSYLTGGASAASTATLGATAASQGMNATQMAGQAVSQMMKDPNYWTSFLQETGNNFQEAQEWAGSDDKAAIYAIIVGLINSGIEVGLDGASGIQGLEKAVRQGNTAPLRDFLKSSAGEGMEEIEQGLVSRGLGQLFGSGAKTFSVTDPDAVINPKTMAEEGAMGAAVGALLSGGTYAINSAVNRANSTNQGKVNQSTQPRTFIDEMMENILGPVETQEAPARSKGEEMIAEMMDAIMGPVETETQKGTPEADPRSIPAAHNGSTGIDESVVRSSEDSLTSGRRYVNSLVDTMIDRAKNGRVDIAEVAQQMVSRGDTNPEDAQGMADAYYTLFSSGKYAVDAAGKLYRTGGETDLSLDERRNKSYELGKRQINAFQFDHPQVHEYYSEAARWLLIDIENTTKGQRIFNFNSTTGGPPTVTGVKRHTSAPVETMLDEYHMTYDRCKDVLQRIINDQGQENIADAKRVEMILDDMLRNGYTDIEGNYVGPNEAYMEAVRGLEGNQDTMAVSEQKNSAPEGNDGLGAADRGFAASDYNSWVENAERFHPEGENAARNPSLPTRNLDGANTSKVGQTVMEAENTPDERVIDIQNQYINGKLTIASRTNESLVKDAVIKLQNNPETTLNEWTKSVASGKVSNELMTMGAVLLDSDRIKANPALWMDVLTSYVKLGSTAGQALQAQRIFKALSPEGRLYMVKKTAQMMTNDVGTQISISDEDAGGVLRAKTDEEMNAALDRIYKHLAEQIPSTFKDKWTALRYMNMLGNFKTQIRNLMGNTLMTGMRAVKNEVAAGIEAAAARLNPNMERTQSARVGKAWMEAAKADFENVKEAAQGNGRYDDTSRTAVEQEIQSRRRIFKSRTLEGYRKITNWATSAGDEVFIKHHYARALAGYLKANGVRVEQFLEGNVDQQLLSRATDFAIKEAQEATFHDNNAFSDWVSKLGRRESTPKAIKVIGEGVAPFRKTPANVLVRAYEYSPLGLIDTVSKAVKAGKGTATASDVINSAARALTGSGIMALGVALRAAGFLRGTGDDDDEAIDSLMNRQDYSIVIPGVGSYTIDWLTPATMPLFMGANLWDIIDSGEMSLADMDAVLAKFTEPILETSMLSGVNDALNNIRFSENHLMQTAATYALSYATQGLTNTLLGQTERVTEPNRMTTYTSSENPLPDWLERTLGQASAKIPGVDFQQTEYRDEFGKTESNGNLVERIFENILSPGYWTSTHEGEQMYDELQDLHDETGEDPWPDASPPKSFTAGGEKYTLDQEAKEKYQQTQGDIYTDLGGQVLNKGKRLFTPEEMVDILVNIKSYAGAQAKKEFYEDHDIRADTTVNFIGKAVAGVQEAGIPFVTYLDFWCKKDNLNYEVDENGKKKVKEAVVKLIDSMRLTNAQKDWLYNKEGYKGEVTWH